MRSTHMRSGLSVGLAAVVCAIAAPGAASQGRWNIDQESSLAWWQVDPHLNHLWATTCPQDPSWRPGQDRTGGTDYDYALEAPKAGFSNTVDTIPMPAFPRLGQAEPLCAEAVSGEVTVAEPATWGGVTGSIRVLSEALQTGSETRDQFMHRNVLQTNRYRHIEFAIDSVAPLQVGDTLRGMFHGTLRLLGIRRQFSGPVKAWMEGDNLRVQARLKMLARDLVKEYNVSEYTLGLAVSGGLWRWLFVGVDLLLRPAS